MNGDIKDNSRTVRLIEELGANAQLSVLKMQKSVIGIYISNRWYNSINGKTALGFLVDILVRMFNIIIIEVEGINPLTPDFYLVNLIQKANSINKNITLDNTDMCDISIMIGNDYKQKKCHIYISCDGWDAYSGFEMVDIKAEDSKVNPIGASLSSAFGAAEIFKCVLKEELVSANKKLKFKDIKFSAFTYDSGNSGRNPSLPDDINIGETLLIGAGAVGMAFISVLRHMNISGNLTIIDHDIVDASNLDRYIGVYADSINNQKTSVAKAALSHLQDLNISEINSKYQQYVESFGRVIDVAICTVDNDETRQELQCDLPRILLNGVTGQSTFSVSRHDFINDGCLGCLYPIEKDKFVNEEKYSHALGIPVGDFTYRYENNIPLTQNDIEKLIKFINTPEIKLTLKAGITLREFLADREICGRLNITGDSQIQGTIGFVSAIPGILLVAELIKERYFKEYALKNLFHSDTLTGPCNYSLQLRKRISECSSYCHDPIMQQVYKSKYLEPHV
jgi:molybdopterin/thiamine biosynthesis adenylyltransferase